MALAGALVLPAMLQVRLAPHSWIIKHRPCATLSRCARQPASLNAEACALP